MEIDTTTQVRTDVHDRVPAGPVRVVYAVALAAGAVALGVQVGPRVLAGGPGLWAALLVVVAAAGVAALVIRWLDRFGFLHRRGALTAFGWGALVATACSGPLTNTVQTVVTARTGPVVGQIVGDVVAAPVVEEILKTAGVLAAALLVRRALSTPLHGMLLGMASGLGFLLVENIVYATKGAQAGGNAFGGALAEAGSRIAFSVAGQHWLFTAMGGLAIGFLLAPTDPTSIRSRAGRRAAAAALLVLGIVLHAVNNSPSLGALVPAGQILYTVGGLGVVHIVATWLLLRRLEPAHGRLRADALAAHGDAVDDDTRALLRSRGAARRARRTGGRTRDQQRALVIRSRACLEA